MDQCLRRFRRKRGPPRPRRSDSVRQLVRRDVLQQVPDRTGLQSCVHLLLVLKARECDDPDIGISLADRLRSRDTIDLGHEEIHEHDVGTLVTAQADRFVAILRLTNQLEILERVQEGPEAAPDDGVIVNDEHTDPLAPSHHIWTFADHHSNHMGSGEAFPLRTTQLLHGVCRYQQRDCFIAGLPPA